MADEAWFNGWLKDFLEIARKHLDAKVESGKMTAEEAVVALGNIKDAHLEIRERERREIEAATLAFLEFPFCHAELFVFAEKLKGRQGTNMPDFAALYREKQELDRKLFGPPETPQ